MVYTKLLTLLAPIKYNKVEKFCSNSQGRRQKIFQRGDNGKKDRKLAKTKQ